MTRALVFQQEVAADSRRHPQRREEIVRNAQRRQPLRLSAAGVIERIEFVCSQVLPGLLSLLPIVEVRSRSGELKPTAPGIAFPYPNQLVWFRVRQLAQQHRVDDAKDRRVRADPKRK